MLSGKTTNPVSRRTMTAFDALFDRFQCQPVETEILQNADPFLETAGEDLRRRMFTSTGSAGEELCLRPDFTIPVCLHHLQSQTDLPRRYGYLGPVFRQREEGPQEFLQAGVEHLGRTDTPYLVDADMMAIAVDAVLMPDASAVLSLKLGDPSLFHQLLVSLDVPLGLRNRLIRAFGRGLDEAALKKALSSAETQETALPADLGKLVHKPEALTQAVADMMLVQGLSLHAGRSAEEISGRYLEAYGPQDFGLSEQHKARLETVLSDYLQMNGPALEMPDRLIDFEQRHQISFGNMLAQFTDRLDAFSGKLGTTVPKSFSFSSSFARPLDYYTGFVFELFANGASRPVAGGGRYDRLMEILGSNDPVPAVGFSLWLDRMPKWSDTDG